MTNLPRCCGSRHKNQKSPRVQVSRASNVYTRTAGTFRLGCLHCARASQSAYTRYDLEWNRAKAHEVASLTMPSHVPAFHRRRMCTRYIYMYIYICVHTHISSIYARMCVHMDRSLLKFKRNKGSGEYPSRDFHALLARATTFFLRRRKSWRTVSDISTWIYLSAIRVWIQRIFLRNVSTNLSSPHIRFPI